MRRFLFALFLLAACQMTAPGDTAAPPVPPPGDDAIAVTTLGDGPQGAAAASLPAPPAEAAPKVAAAGPDTPHPKGRPAADAAKPAAPAEAEAAKPDAAPAVPLSPQQVLCEKSGGQWAAAGDSGASLCVRRTKDAGKRCSRKTDCQGQCLARSESCSPIDPMIGCNDVFEKDGRMVTLCLN